MNAGMTHRTDKLETSLHRRPDPLRAEHHKGIPNRRSKAHLTKRSTKVLVTSTVSTPRERQRIQLTSVKRGKQIP